MNWSKIIPFESTVNTAVEKISDGVITKMNHAEEQRNREFTYRLKELEFYKSNYDKDLKDIFDYWFEIVRVVHIKDNENLSEAEKSRYQKKFVELSNIDKIAKYKMNTLKYGGTETGRVLAVMSSLNQKRYSNKPSQTDLYIWCSILAVLKKDILGQELNPSDILRVLVNDFDDHLKDVDEAKHYIKNYYYKIYKEEPFWLR